MNKYFSPANLKGRITSPGMIILFTAIGVGLAYLIPTLGLKFGVTILVLFVGIPFLITALVNIQIGFILLFLFASFAFVIGRIFQPDFPMGIVIEILFLPLILGILLRKPSLNVKKWIDTPTILIIIIWLCYLLLEIVNPGGSLQGWFFGFRLSLRLFFTFIIAYFAIDNFNYLKTFIFIWLLIALITSLYSYYQEFVGLPSWDMEWATATLRRKQLLFIGGHWRKWSILSGGSDLGIFMAMSSLFCIIMSFGPFSPIKRLIFILLGIVMMISMSFSGTRTAYAMFVSGIVFFIIITANSGRSIIVTIVFTIFISLILFGPFENGAIRRIRSTFQPTDDPSYMTREVNQDRIRPYLLSHPIGGGLLSTGGTGEEYAAGNPLAGFPADSFYVKTALETGWIGLIIQMVMFSIVMITGIKNYFLINDIYKKHILLALNAAFFILTVGGFSQVPIDQLPYGIIFHSIMAININITSW